MNVGEQYTLHFSPDESRLLECVLSSYDLPQTSEGLKEFVMRQVRAPEGDRAAHTISKFIQENPELVRLGAQMIREIPTFLQKKMKRAL